MLWEAHITVKDDDVDGWCAYCTSLNRSAKREVKPLYIELTTGEHPKQLMFAARWEGELDDSGWQLARLVTQVRRKGFTILRQKLECPLDKAYDQKPFGENSYSECHMKLMLSPSEARDTVGAACVYADVHASRNLLADKDGLQKWYLTRRDYVHPIRGMAATFNRALARVQEVAPVLRMEMEYVVYDSNLELDRGWAGE